MKIIDYRTDPFQPFYSTNVFGPNGSQFVSNPVVRAKLLAEAIPATSRATGRNPVPLLFSDNNKDMNVEFKNGWPEDRHNDNNADPWLHGDFRGIAYFFNYKLYDDISTRGVFQ